MNRTLKHVLGSLVFLAVLTVGGIVGWQFTSEWRAALNRMAFTNSEASPDARPSSLLQATENEKEEEDKENVQVTTVFQAGRHPLIEISPCTADDVLRQLGSGFDHIEIERELRRRGFSGFRNENERAEYATRIPAPLLAIMESPAVLLSKEAQAEYGRRLSGHGADVIALVKADDARIQNMLTIFGARRDQLPREFTQHLSKRGELSQAVETLRKERRKILESGGDATLIHLKVVVAEQKLRQYLEVTALEQK